MARYIDAVKTVEIISEKCGIDVSELVDIFAEIPTADVEPVRHGKWIKTTGTDTRYTCSRCDNHYLCDFDLDLKYCPN